MPVLPGVLGIPAAVHWEADMDDINQLFGRRLRSLREQRGLTQEQLGEQADVSFKHLGAIERGSENPTIELVGKLATALNVQARDLFEFEHEKTTPAELRRSLNDLLKEADVAALQQAVKLLRAILR
jgi:transcriptional regulator with XRE-family HTH domain